VIGFTPTLLDNKVHKLMVNEAAGHDGASAQKLPGCGRQGVGVG
jgi:hypothetical protein